MSAASSALRKHPPTTRLSIASSSGLLSALQAAHLQIDTAFAEMEGIASAEVTDLQHFSAARMRIGQANLARRRIVEKVSSHLISVVCAEVGEAVREHRRRDENYFQNVSELVRKWTPDAVLQNWNGYCTASRTIREGTLAIIAAEKGLLYPLLEGRSLELPPETAR